MSYAYEIYDVFTTTAFWGNPLAVFKAADGLSDEEMQTIAKEMNLSETVFIFPPEKAGDHRLRIFTPTVELPFAGHPTIGAALALKAADQTGMTLEVIAGIIPIDYHQGQAVLTSPVIPKQIAAQISPDIAAELLSLPSTAIVSVAAADGGVPFTIIKVSDRAALSQCQLSLTVWQDHLSHSLAPHIYLFCRVESQQTLHTRMFAPATGISEDPATGGAAVAISALLDPGQYEIHQGEDMGRPSLLHLTVGDSIRLGGAAIKIAEGRLL